MPDFNHQQDDTGGLLAAFLGLIFLIAFIVVCIWVSAHML